MVFLCGEVISITARKWASEMRKSCNKSTSNRKTQQLDDLLKCQVATEDSKLNCLLKRKFDCNKLFRWVDDDKFCSEFVRVLLLSLNWVCSLFYLLLQKTSERKKQKTFCNIEKCVARIFIVYCRRNVCFFKVLHFGVSDLRPICWVRIEIMSCNASPKIIELIFAYVFRSKFITRFFYSKKLLQQKERTKKNYLQKYLIFSQDFQPTYSFKFTFYRKQSFVVPGIRRDLSVKIFHEVKRCIFIKHDSRAQPKRSIWIMRGAFVWEQMFS